MVRYTGKWFTVKNCAAFDGKDVNVLEYKDDEKHGSWCHEFCTRCGKPLKSHYFVVQDQEDIEIAYLGADCVGHLA